MGCPGSAAVSSHFSSTAQALGLCGEPRTPCLPLRGASGLRCRRGAWAAHVSKWTSALHSGLSWMPGSRARLALRLGQEPPGQRGPGLPAAPNENEKPDGRRVSLSPSPGPVPQAQAVAKLPRPSLRRDELPATLRPLRRPGARQARSPQLRPQSRGTSTAGSPGRLGQRGTALRGVKVPGVLAVLPQVRVGAELEVGPPRQRMRLGSALAVWTGPSKNTLGPGDQGPES